MTLKELQARIGEVIAENERRGWAERNNLPLAVEMVRTKTHYGKIVKSIIPINYLLSSMLTVNGNKFGAQITCNESDDVRP